MKKLFRHGRRTVCVVALVVLLPLGCSATRTVRVAQKPPVEVASVEPGDAEEESGAGRTSLTTALSAATDTEELSHVTQVSALNDAPVESRPDEGVRTTGAAAIASSSASAPYPLNLGGVLGLADGQNPQVILARERINESSWTSEKEYGFYLLPEFPSSCFLFLFLHKYFS